jgi:phytoene dehydrogenase-like protein
VSAGSGARDNQLPSRADVVVVGAGHNGLVAATLLARAGLQVVVLERSEVVGGAARTEAPFARVPQLRQSTGAYLLGLMPPELIALLDVQIPLLRRDPHYFLPTLQGRSYLFGSDGAANLAQLSARDRAADEQLGAELSALRSDLAPAWLAEPGSVEETAYRYVRPSLQAAFVDLCRGSVADYLARFDFADELLVAMYAVTDGLSGLHAGPDTPGSGHNFLVHNMCRLPGAGGTWMVVQGGMGTVTQRIAEAARAAGAVIAVDAAVTGIEPGVGVHLADGRTVAARVVVGGCDPFRLAELLGPAVDPSIAARLESVRLPGSTMKVNLALSRLPEFSCQPPGSPTPLGSTVHLLPGGERPMDAVRAMWSEVQAGRLPDFPTIEWYVHTTVDPSLQDPAGHHSSALFVQSVPYALAEGTWDEHRDAYAAHVIGIADRFAPGTADAVADVFALAPPDIERHFGITGGHIHHVDNGVAFADRVPYSWGNGVYAASAGCHPAGSVIGAAGHNAAQRVLVDLGLPRA